MLYFDRRILPQFDLGYSPLTAGVLLNLVSKCVGAAVIVTWHKKSPGNLPGYLFTKARDRVPIALTITVLR